MLLQAYVGALTNGLTMLKDSALLAVHKRYIPYLTLALLVPIWAIGLFLLKQWHDILPLIGASLFNLSFMFRDNRPLMARGAMIGQPFWVVYNIIVGSWIGIAYNIIVCTSSLIGMSRHEQWNLKSDYIRFIPRLVRAFFTLPKEEKSRMVGQEGLEPPTKPL